MRKNVFKGLGVALLGTALVASLGAAATSAFASQGKVADGTSWTIPTGQMPGGNTVTVNGKLYKVITTWANAWALSGPDYIGVSNSGSLNQQGGGGSTASLTVAQTTTMLGAWASEANEVPNAYNWNYFWNLYAADANLPLSQYADFQVVEVSNGAAASFQEGVYGPFKYRPEIIWTSNSLNATTTATYTQLIRDGKYFTSGTDYSAGKTADKSAYYINGDENYNPKIISARNGSPFTFSASLYDLATMAEDVEAQTANYNANGAITASNVTWKTMNDLPRTTRYEASEERPMTARECALEFEKVTKGAVYYTLSKIADGTVQKKKVAFLTKDPDTTGDTATVVVFDGIDNIGTGVDSGYASFAPVTVTQLGEDKDVSTGVVNTAQKANGVSSVTYTVTCDELATCDYIMDTAGGGITSTSAVTPETLKAWVMDNASSAALKESASKAQYATVAPAMMNMHGYTIEKALFGAFNLGFIYSELFPNMELLAYYYDNIYHLKSDSLKTALQWGLGNVSLPNDVSLSSLSDNYSIQDMENKFKLGYDYYSQAFNTDEIFKMMQGTTGRFTGTTDVDYTSYLPTEYYKEWADSYEYVKDAQVIKATPATKTFTLKKVAKAAKSFQIKVTGATGKVSYSVTNKVKKAGVSVSSSGKVTVKKGTKKGTYKVAVKAAATKTLSAGKATVTVKVK